MKSLAIFGSYARRENKKGSDVDILVEFVKTPGFFKFIELEDYLTEILGSEVDLVTNKALKPKIKTQIIKDSVYV